MTTETAREVILTLSAAVYSGLSKTLVFGDGSQIRYTFVKICEILDVEYQRYEKQHHSALEIGE